MFNVYSQAAYEVVITTLKSSKNRSKPMFEPDFEIQKGSNLNYNKT